MIARVFVGGMERGVFRFTIGSPSQRLRVALDGPASPLDGETKVELLVNDTRSPLQLGANQDRRHLGLHVRSLSILRRGT